MKPEIFASPNPALIDDKIDIVIRNLKSNAPVTVSSYLYKGSYLYLGLGHFYARVDGSAVVGEDTSYGGTYLGRAPMGLFSSMKLLPTKKLGGRIYLENAEEKLKFRVSVWKGHKTQDDIHRLHMYYEGFATIKDPPEIMKATSAFRDSNFIADIILERNFLHPSVTRTEISSGRIRGALFVPLIDPIRVKEKLPGIIEISSRFGQCSEQKAALLAKEGFVTFAVSLKELRRKEEITADLLEEMAQWLSARMDVLHVGVVGSNLLGVDLCVTAALQCEGVKAAACVGPPLNFEKGEIDGVEIFGGKFEIASAGELTAGATRPYFNRIRGRNLPMLVLYGENTPAALKWRAMNLKTQLGDRSGVSVFSEEIPGLGMILDPPYTPRCLEGTLDFGQDTRLENLLMRFDEAGHDCVNAEYGQLAAWGKLVTFLKNNLAQERFLAKI